MIHPPPFRLGDYVTKNTGDYTTEGWIMASITKKSGATRYVIETPQGMLLVLNENQITLGKEPDDVQTR